MKIMAIDQYGNAIHGPLKALLGELRAKHASKIYRDKNDGSSVHIGYVVSGRWFEFFKVEPWEVKS